MKNKLILASGSPRRIQLLSQIMVIPDLVVPADIDESALNGELPKDICLRLAIEKARTVHKTHPEAFILAADTVVACGRRILPKTETAEETQKCLKLLSGRRHRVYGGIALMDPDGVIKTKRSVTIINFKRLSVQEIDLYIKSEQWKGVAGGYAIQGYASAFVKSINGSYSNVVGLCLYDTMKLLKGDFY